MLVGGIGSGKTTQLLRVQQRLAQVDDVRVFYVDVLAQQAEEHVGKKGALLALAALELGELLAKDDPAQAAAKSSREIATGYWLSREDVYEEIMADEDWYDDEFVHRPGIILTPEETDNNTKRLLKNLSKLVEAMPFQPVFLFDGLDRLSDMTAFAELSRNDVPVLQWGRFPQGRAGSRVPD